MSSHSGKVKLYAKMKNKQMNVDIFVAGKMVFVQMILKIAIFMGQNIVIFCIVKTVVSRKISTIIAELNMNAKEIRYIYYNFFSLIFINNYNHVIIINIQYIIV